MPSPHVGQLELAVDLAALLLDADGEGLDAALGHEPLAQRLEDVLDVALSSACSSSRPSRT